MNLVGVLKKLGLNEKEALVYLAGLELGPASIKALSIKSKVKRTTIYPLLEDLKEKALFIETVKKKKLLYVAAHPNQLKMIVNEKQLVLENGFNDLLSVTNSNLGRPSVEYYDSVEGIYKMYEDALSGVSKDTIGLAGDVVVEGLGEEWLRKYVNKRKRAGVGAKTLSVDGELAKKWQKNDAVDGRKIKFLPGKVDLPVNIEVIEDKVLISSLEGEVIGLVIKSDRISCSLRNVLEMLWDKLD